MSARELVTSTDDQSLETALARLLERSVALNEEMAALVRLAVERRPPTVASVVSFPSSLHRLSSRRPGRTSGKDGSDSAPVEGVTQAAAGGGRRHAGSEPESREEPQARNEPGSEEALSTASVGEVSQEESPADAQPTEDDAVEQRERVLSLAAEGRSHREIAIATGRSYDVVRGVLRRAVRSRDPRALAHQAAVARAEQAKNRMSAGAVEACFDLWALGCTRGEIADALGVSEAQVKHAVEAGRKRGDSRATARTGGYPADGRERPDPKPVLARHGLLNQPRREQQMDVVVIEDGFPPPGNGSVISFKGDRVIGPFGDAMPVNSAGRMAILQKLAHGGMTAETDLRSASKQNHIAFDHNMRELIRPLQSIGVELFRPFPRGYWRIRAMDRQP